MLPVTHIDTANVSLELQLSAVGRRSRSSVVYVYPQPAASATLPTKQTIAAGTMVMVSVFRPLPPLLISRGSFALSAVCRRAPVARLSAAPKQYSATSARRCFGAIGGQGQEGLDVDRAKGALRRAQAVCFDVDSTVIAEEGIDVLAEFCGAAEAVADLTSRAMGGSMPFQDALKTRLDLMTPSKDTVDRCLTQHPPRLSPGISELVTVLHDRGVVVYLISGGFRQMIEPVADQLAIPRGNIFANRLLFDKNGGNYTGFDAEEPTSRDGGKPKVIDLLAKEFGYTCVVMVGDGATDMQAKPPAEAFIGYGGVTVREPVRKGADWFVTDFAPLIKALEDGGVNQPQ
ncbi:unnamed protein product [Pylaiella littoralis]